MSERWGDSQRDRDALDRWLTDDPRGDEPEPFVCEWCGEPDDRPHSRFCPDLDDIEGKTLDD